MSNLYYILISNDIDSRTGRCTKCSDLSSNSFINDLGGQKCTIILDDEKIKVVKTSLKCFHVKVPVNLRTNIEVNVIGINNLRFKLSICDFDVWFPFLLESVEPVFEHSYYHWATRFSDVAGTSDIRSVTLSEMSGCCTGNVSSFGFLLTTTMKGICYEICNITVK